MAEKITKRDYQEWLLFCSRVQTTTGVNFSESKDVQNQRIKRALKDYNFFVKTYFKVYCDEGKTDCGVFHIEAAEAIKKDPNIWAVLEWPREHAKSVHSTIIIPMWLIAHKELTGMILMGKNDDDACNLLSDVQAQLQFNDLFSHDFGNQYNFGSWADGDFTTREGIRFLACGRDKSPRGARKGEKRPNYGVIDDVDDDEIIYNQKRVKKVVKRIRGAFYGALSIKGSRVVMSGNRIHPQSILAHIVGDIKPGVPKNEAIWHSKIYATDGGFMKGNPAWPERYTIEELVRKMKKMGILEAKVEYYHEHHVDGEIFKDEAIQWKPMPKHDWINYIVIIGYFDPSFENNPKSDYKAVRVWAMHVKNATDYEKHCLKSFVQRTETETAFEFMSKFEDVLPSGVAVIWYMEKQFFNRPLRQALERHNNERARSKRRKLYITEDGRDKPNKYTRIVRMEPDYTSRIVYYNIDEFYNSDMVEGNNQLKEIEPGYNSSDDSPDADEGAWYFLDDHIPSSQFEPVIGSDKNKKGW